jgi:aspartyl-tRNA(Asn)/glutamyl-tRNA(Gln) amidotransferase subunit C
MLFFMEIDKQLLLHVAEVARINLTESEIKEFLPQLKEIIKAFSEIQEVNTEGIGPSFHPIELKNSLREDIPKLSLTNEEALSNTKHKKDGYFKGPRIL